MKIKHPRTQIEREIADVSRPRESLDQEWRDACRTLGYDLIEDGSAIACVPIYASKPRPSKRMQRILAGLRARGNLRKASRRRV